MPERPCCQFGEEMIVLRKALVLGGTRFMGKHLVAQLLSTDWEVTLATRGQTKDAFGDRVQRLVVERTDPNSLKAVLSGKSFDVIFDSLAYCSNDVKFLLDVLHPERYVQISSASVYDGIGEGCHVNTREEEFDPGMGGLVYCNREDFSYDEIKRQAERAIVQAYPNVSSTMARFPYVIGTDDYTDRLYFYVEHAVKGLPMNVQSPDAKIAFVRSDEAGKFLAFLGELEGAGPVNGASSGAVSMGEVLRYAEEKTGKSPVFSLQGDRAPYDGEQDFTLNTEKAEGLGFRFTPLQDWIWKLIDEYIKRAEAC